MKCEVCGKENKEGALFCSECGKAFVDEPIKLDLQQIKIPAAARKAHIIKVSALKKSSEPEISEEKAEPEQPHESEALSDKAPNELIGLESEKEENESEPEKAEPSAEDKTSVPMSMVNWLPVFILSCIPLVNIIMLFVWSFSSKTKKKKKSYARLSLIFCGICLVLLIAAAIIAVRLFGVNYEAVLKGKFPG